MGGVGAGHEPVCDAFEPPSFSVSAFEASVGAPSVCSYETSQGGPDRGAPPSNWAAPIASKPTSRRTGMAGRPPRR